MTSTVQELPCGRDAGQLFDWLNPVPLMEARVTVRAAVPELVKETLLTLVWPAGTVSNDTLAGDTSP